MFLCVGVFLPGRVDTGAKDFVTAVDTDRHKGFVEICCYNDQSVCPGGAFANEWGKMNRIFRFELCGWIPLLVCSGVKKSDLGLGVVHTYVCMYVVGIYNDVANSVMMWSIPNPTPACATGIIIIISYNHVHPSQSSLASLAPRDIAPIIGDLLGASPAKRRVNNCT